MQEIEAHYNTRQGVQVLLVWRFNLPLTNVRDIIALCFQISNI